MQIPVFSHAACLIAIVGLTANSIADEPAAPYTATDQPPVTALVSELKSANFATRVKASVSLKNLSIAELENIADLPEQQLNAEVAARLFAEVDLRYMSDDKTVGNAASELLERFSRSERLVLADGAQRVLNKRWQRRVELTAVLLEEMGAKFRKGSFTGTLAMRWGPAASQPEVQLFIGEEWKGGDRGIAVMERLQFLADPSLRASGLRVWLLEGHPLSESQRSQLRDLVGESRINERSRVALGIIGEQNFARGVMVRHVNQGSSAAAAKIKIGDVLTAMFTEPPAADVAPEDIEVNDEQTLKDFDDLVERLKAFREGDHVWLLVERGVGIPMNRGFILPPQRFPLPPQREPKIQLMKVKLKGWAELKATSH